MKTLDLYLRILKHVRYEILSLNGVTLNDFEPDSKGYELLCSLNQACNELSNLIDVMKYENVEDTNIQA